jgi:integrase
MLMNRLTAAAVAKTIKPGCYADGGNLYLQVTKTKVRSWLFRYMIDGEAKSMGLGPVHTITLAEAREKALAARKQLLEGVDPVEAKREIRQAEKAAKAKAITFDEAAEKYIAAHRAGWKNGKHGGQWANTLAKYASPIIGKLNVAEIDTPLVMKVLTQSTEDGKNLWEAKTETASRLRGRIESILAWATVSEFRRGDNPARWTNHLDQLLPARRDVAKVEHFAALPYAEIYDFIVTLRQQEGMGARALEFAILTACRSGEVRGATWGEFDLDGAVWTIPSSRMKAKKEHVVPLSGAALALLKGLPRLDGVDVVFPSPTGKAFSDAVFSALLKRMGRTETAHGFRSSFRDWAGEVSAHPREVIEHALAHQLKDKAEASYQRGTLFDKRTRLMADWATYCNTPRLPASVTPIRGAA